MALFFHIFFLNVINFCFFSCLLLVENAVYFISGSFFFLFFFWIFVSFKILQPVTLLLFRSLLTNLFTALIISSGLDRIHQIEDCNELVTGQALLCALLVN